MIELYWRKKMKYEKQKTDYNCVPASLRMMLSYYDLGDIFTQKEISYMVDTDKDGTIYKNCKHFLDILGFRMHNINFKKARKMAANGDPFLISYDTSNSQSHCSVVVGYDDKKDMYILYDPWYGKNIKIPFYLLENTLNNIMELIYIK
jgi:ABC-type bacteriocin/lantibiotic exporter with double-glycine peptidase domain